MVEKAAATTLAFIEGISKLWPIVVAIVIVIGYCYTLANRVTDVETAINAGHILQRVQTLEDEQKNDSGTVSSEYQNTQGQLQSVQGHESEISSSLSQIGQDVATLKAQVQFLINQDYPNHSVVAGK